MLDLRKLIVAHTYLLLVWNKSNVMLKLRMSGQRDAVGSASDSELVNHEFELRTVSRNGFERD